MSFKCCIFLILSTPSGDLVTDFFVITSMNYVYCSQSNQLFHWCLNLNAYVLNFDTLISFKVHLIMSLAPLSFSELAVALLNALNFCFNSFADFILVVFLDSCSLRYLVSLWILCVYWYFDHEFFETSRVESFWGLRRCSSPKDHFKFSSWFV